MNQNNEVKKNADTKVEKNSIFGNFKPSLFLIVFLLIVIVRLNFFFITIDQPLWWDESEYMSGAKGIAGIVDYDLSGRSPGFSLVASTLFILGLDSEFLLRFFLTLIPSLLALLLTYFVGKEMYDDEKIGIISMLIMAFIWEHIFYSNRFHTENLSLIFQYLAIFVMYKGYIKKEKILNINSKYSLFLVALLSIIAVIFRPGNIVFIPALIIFIPLINYKFLSENKKKTYAGVIALFLAGIILLFNLDKIPIVSTYYNTVSPISFNTLNVFYGFYRPALFIQGLFFYFFLIGIVALLLNLWIKMPLIKEFRRDENNLELKSDIFSLLLIVSVLFCVIFLMRMDQFEYRWLFPLALGMLTITSKGIINISRYIGKMSKEAPMFFIMGVLILGLYGQYDFSKDLVQGKVTSYQQVKDAGLWIKENSNKEDIVVSASLHQNTYYSERKTYGFALDDPKGEKNETYFNEHILKIKPRYLIISAFEPAFTPEWAYNWPQINQNNTIPVQIYFADAQKQQPILVIYEVKYG